jgi:uncharacterized phage protein (TIGR02218 family)
MAKTASAALIADIQRDVTTLATLVRIVRTDQKTFLLTNHDTNITFDGEIYTNDFPFTLSSITSSSNFTVDNVEMSLKLDGTTFTRDDFVDGAFTHAKVTISQVDFDDPTSGNIIVRDGWIGKLSYSELDIVNLTVEGLLKVLDLEVGRIYQPTCDADFGDERCGVAVDFGQEYSQLTKYHVGSWVYKFNGTETDFSLTNQGFEADGGVAGFPTPGTITGWSRSSGNFAEVADTGLDGLTALEGSYILYFRTDDTAASSGAESYVFQDITTAVAGLNTAKIDTGDYYLRGRIGVAQSTDLENRWRVEILFRDAAGSTLRTYDSTYQKNPELDVFQEHTFSRLVPALTRSFQIRLWALKANGSTIGVGFDDVRMSFWDHTGTLPTDERIYKCVRVFDRPESQRIDLGNESFEADGPVANTNSTSAIDSWNFSTSDFWQVVTSTTNLSAQDGSHFLLGGDDASGTQSTYQMTQDVTLANEGVSETDIDLGNVTMSSDILVGFEAITSTALIEYIWLDDVDAVISTTTAGTITATVTGWTTQSTNVIVPANTRKLRIRLSSTSPVGSSVAETAFDSVDVWFFLPNIASQLDPAQGMGNQATETVFNPTVGELTYDGDLVWKAVTQKTDFDVVATVINENQEFNATNLSGTDDVFVTSEIEWVTGNNVGRRNIIRKWTETGKIVKLYFKTIQPIQVGDKFRYIIPCQKRFVEDCKVTHDNVINFRGFPHLPGRVF